MVANNGSKKEYLDKSNMQFRKKLTQLQYCFVKQKKLKTKNRISVTILQFQICPYTYTLLREMIFSEAGGNI